MKCYTHPEKDAIGTCERCGRGVCPECSVSIDGKNICKNCASIIASHDQALAHKEPVLALILSFFIPGMGQLYLGNNDRGFKLIIGAIIAWVLTAVCIGLFIYFGIWIYGMYDAYTSAEKINRGEISFSTS
jgi:TM2 domain-containing membrane protein YozV